MSDSVRSSGSQRITPLAIGFVAMLCALPLRAADMDILQLRKSVSADEMVLTFDVLRPADMGELTIERGGWVGPSSPAWPRMPELRSNPPSACLAYLQYVRENYWDPAPRRDRLTFIGLCRTAGEPLAALDLTLRYPLADGSWKDAPLHIALGGAEAIPAPTTGPRNTPTQDWALAQARHFALLARHVGDFGGFWSFVVERTCKRFNLEVPADVQSALPARQNGEEQLYAIATGALAIQESLQLDRMAGTLERDDEPQSVEIATIPAVGVKSHPFDEMRGGKEPVDSPLAALVPEEFYFIRFGRMAKLLDLLALADQWGGSLLRLADAPGVDYGVRARVLEQLALTEDVLRALDPLVAEVALVGSDPYLVDGSDVTVLLLPKDENSNVALAALLSGALKDAQQRISKAESHQVDLNGTPVATVTDPERRVNAHLCSVRGAYVLGNSRPAVERVIAAAAGKRPSLAAAADYKYMRAIVFPLDEAQEDGFIYLSDSFIRAVVGPEMRINQQRRLRCAGVLKRIVNGMLLYRYERGGDPLKDDAFHKDGYLDVTDLSDAIESGVFSGKHATPTHAVWGRLGNLTPLIEVAATHCTPDESRAYGEFRDRYEQYWRTYFDPIAVRIRTEPALRFEVCILPLINSSVYDEFVETAGGAPIDVPVHAFTPTTLFRFVMKFADGRTKQQAAGLFGMMGMNAATDWLGDWVTFWVEDTDAFLKLVRREYDERLDPSQRNPGQEIIDIFDASFVGGIHVKNKVSLAAFLVSLRAFVLQAAPDTVVFNTLPPHRDVTIVQIAPHPNQQWLDGNDAASQPTTAADGNGATTQPAISEKGPALYYATIGAGFYVATQASALRRLIDRQFESAAAQPPALRNIQANVLVYAAPGAAERIRPTVSFLLEQRARETSIRNLAQVWLLGRCGALEGRSLDEASAAFLGYRLACPHDSTYTYDAAQNVAISSIYGDLHAPKRFDAPPAGSPLSKLLDSLETLTGAMRFTTEGLMTTVEIERR